MSKTQPAPPLGAGFSISTPGISTAAAPAPRPADDVGGTAARSEQAGNSAGLHRGAGADRARCPAGLVKCRVAARPHADAGGSARSHPLGARRHPTHRRRRALRAGRRMSAPDTRFPCLRVTGSGLPLGRVEQACRELGGDRAYNGLVISRISSVLLALAATVRYEAREQTVLAPAM